jgi:hypothetical protein
MNPHRKINASNEIDLHLTYLLSRIENFKEQSTTEKIRITLFIQKALNSLTKVTLTRFREAFIERTLAYSRNNLDLLFNISNNYSRHSKSIKSIAILEEISNRYKGEDRIDSLLNLSLCRLRLGDFRKGFIDYDIRFFVKSHDEYHTADYDRFNLKGLSDFKFQSDFAFYFEQGLGENLLALPAFHKISKEKHLRLCFVSPRFIPILRSLYPRLKFESKDKIHQYSQLKIIPSLSFLGVYLGEEHQTITKYRQNLRVFRRPRIRFDLNTPRIGICATTLKSIRTEKNVSIKALLLAAKNCFSDAMFVVFGQNSLELRNIINKASLEHVKVIDQSQPIVKLYREMKKCDFFFTSSGSLAHMAGLIGIRTALFLNRGVIPLWYWGDSCNQSYFYRSVKIYREGYNFSTASLCLPKFKKAIRKTIGLSRTGFLKQVDMTTPQNSGHLKTRDFRRHYR